MRRVVVLSCLLLAAPAARAEAPFTLPEGDRMRLVTHGLGWTVLRDATAPRGTAEMGMLLVRAQRPVPPAARPGHLIRTLQNLRTLRVGALPAEEHTALAGLPADLLLARATGAPSGVPVVVRAACLYTPARSWLLVASAPAADWPGLEAEMARLMAGFRPG